MAQSGMTLLLTRPVAQARRFAASCRAEISAELPIVIAPILRIEPRNISPDIAGATGVVLTSENGARALADIADVTGLLAWCVGDRTARVAGELGMAAVSAGGSADELVAMVIRHAPKGAVVHMHGAKTRGDIADRLKIAGINASSVVIYDQIAQRLSKSALSSLQSDQMVVLPLFSPRSARLVATQLPEIRARLAIVALSPAVASAWGNVWTGQKPVLFTVAKHPDAPHMITEIATIWMDLLA